VLEVEVERRRQITVGGDLRLEIGDLLLGEADPVGAGDEAARRLLLIGDCHQRREFLASRRARITPQKTGLPSYGGARRVPGLRRGEVAELAAVSIEYYTRLERGNLEGVSEGRA
jgi:hypothetical protein